MTCYSDSLLKMRVSVISKLSIKIILKTDSFSGFIIFQKYKSYKVSKVAKIRNRYNQVPHLTQDTNGKVTNSQKTPQTRAKRSALSQQVTTKLYSYEKIMHISDQRKSLVQVSALTAYVCWLWERSGTVVECLT